MEVTHSRERRPGSVEQLRAGSPVAPGEAGLVILEQIRFEPMPRHAASPLSPVKPPLGRNVLQLTIGIFRSHSHKLTTTPKMAQQPRATR